MVLFIWQFFQNLFCYYKNLGFLLNKINGFCVYLVLEMERKKAIIIGAGVAGLAVSVRLVLQGFDVEIFESNAYTGGKLSEFQLGRYRFDAGPSLFTMPHLVEELFWIAGKKSDDFLYKKLDEVCRYFFSDGLRFIASADKEKLVEEIYFHLGENKNVIKQYLENGKFKYETIGKLFLERCLRKPSTFLNKNALKAYLKINTLGLTTSLNSYNETTFKNPKTVQLFNRYATYNGSDPYQTPAIMSMIPHLEFGVGAFFPKDGMIQISQSIAKLAESLGVVIYLNTKVSGIKTENGKAVGIESNGVFLKADVVVSAIDVSQTYSKLLGMQGLGEKYLKLPKSTSAIIWYWGIKRKTTQTGLHNIFFSKDYKAEFQSLFEKKEMPAEPTIYLNISSKERTEDAPEFGENWFVMVNAPANEGQDWDKWIPETRKKVMERLSQELGFNVESEIEVETILEPRILESRTGAIGGALYGSNSNSKFAAFLRHANFSSDVKNLYFCGGTVHPGGGIPLALQSASIAAEYVKNNSV